MVSQISRPVTSINTLHFKWRFVDDIYDVIIQVNMDTVDTEFLYTRSPTLLLPLQLTDLNMFDTNIYSNVSFEIWNGVCRSMASPLHVYAVTILWWHHRDEMSVSPIHSYDVTTLWWCNADVMVTSPGHFYYILTGRNALVTFNFRWEAVALSDKGHHS